MLSLYSCFTSVLSLSIFTFAPIMSKVLFGVVIHPSFCEKSPAWWRNEQHSKSKVYRETTLMWMVSFLYIRYTVCLIYTSELQVKAKKVSITSLGTFKHNAC